MINFTCLSSRGVMLEESDRIFLVLASCEMAQKGQAHRKVKDDGIRGDIFTNFRRTPLGSLSGIAFEAEITTPKGDIAVRYIISDQDLNKSRSDLTAGNQKWHSLDGYFSDLIWEIIGKALQQTGQVS
ncbi:MAG: hypothetical protein V1845_00570 [bacterium]